jgi:2-deoxy-D-gluconate 3-dehydrogenase
VPHVADVADLDALPAHVREIGTRQAIDGVVHAAGVQIRRPAVDYPVEEWDQVLRVNAQAPFFLSTAIAREQRAAGRPGSHVFIGSLASTIGLPNGALYAASKTALLGVARTLSVEMAMFGIRANVVGPGYFPTQLNEDLLSVPENRQRIMSRIPMGRMGTPADLAGIVVFLLCDASRYLTGQLVSVDGGWLGA